MKYISWDKEMKLEHNASGMMSAQKIKDQILNAMYSNSGSTTFYTEDKPMSFDRVPNEYIPSLCFIDILKEIAIPGVKLHKGDDGFTAIATWGDDDE